jgi:hypothetical protein
VFAAVASAADIADFLGDDRTDDGPAIQAAMDSLSDTDGRWPNTSGGVIALPKEHSPYRVETGVVVPCGGITLQGEGNPTTYATWIDWRGGDGALFTIRCPKDKQKDPAGFRVTDLKITSRSYTGTTFRFEQLEVYRHDFYFDRIGVGQFDKVVEVIAGANKYVGGLSFTHCRLPYNTQIVDATDGRINESHFDRCLLSKSGRDGRYAFDLRGGSDISWNRCIVEQQPRFLRARYTYGLSIVGCRFEGNATSRDPVILVEDSAGVYVQRCFNRVLSSESKTTPLIRTVRCRGVDIQKDLSGTIEQERAWGPVW